MKRGNIFDNKKGASELVKLIVLVLAFGFIFLAWNFWPSGGGGGDGSGPTKVVKDTSIGLIDALKNLLDAKDDSPGLFGGVLNLRKKVPGVGLLSGALGFDEGYGDFFGDLFVGALVGLWLFGVYALSRIEASLNPLKWIVLILQKIGVKNVSFGASDINPESSWLGFVGSSPWKIVPTAFVYAVLSQIPIVTSVLKVITLEVLLSYKGTMGALIRSFVIAFYIGFLPTLVERYSRYKLRNKYYNSVEAVRANKKIEKIQRS